MLHHVATAVRRGRKTACAGCGQLGASVRCSAKRCEQAYHFGCALSAGVTFVPDGTASTWCPLHTPKRCLPLPVFVDRSVRIKPFARLHILSVDQQRELREQPPPTAPPPGAPSPQAAAGSALVAPPAPSAAAAPLRAILRIGALRVLRLGKPQPGKPQFHDATHVLPLGFLARRRFHDVLVAGGRCDYLCELREAAGLPHFVISLEREPSVSFQGRSAAAAWSSLQARRHKLLHARTPQLSAARAALEGSLFFGFGCPAVAQLIEQLPGAKACEGFRPRYALPEARQKAPPLPRSASGCARTEPIVKRNSAYKYAHSVYYRPFINRGALPPREGEQGGEGGEEARRVGILNLRRRGDEGRSANLVERNAGNAAGTLLHAVHPVRVGRSAIHNWGLFTTRGVPKDGMVVEYMGQALRNSMADRKERQYTEGALAGMAGDCYMFRLDAGCVLDATMRGNVARYINHCCTPNCYSKVIVDNDGKGHIVIFAQRDLDEGEEVTYDYKFATERTKITCYCGAKGCLGVMN